MSFRLFVYYCALCGGWAAFAAWLLTRAGGIDRLAPELQSPLLAGVLGMLVATAVGTMDALLNYARPQRPGRVLICLGFGLAGGLVGGLLGEVLNQLLNKIVRLPLLGWNFLGWVLVGVAIGASVGIFDLLGSFRAGAGGTRMAFRKTVNGVWGGMAGGLVGGLLYGLLDGTGLKNQLPRTSLALGLVVLGSAIGLLIGLAQVILTEASVRVEAGFRAGRQMILTKPETVIGRAEGSDIGLFGDAGVERTHARILLQGPRYVLADAGTGGGTYLNDVKIAEPTPLRSGDAIKLGNSVLRFEERHKRAEAE